MKKKINLLHLVTGLGVGGAERVVLDLAKNATFEKFNIFVVSLSKRTEMLKEFESNNINTIALKKGNSAKEFFQIISFLNTYVKKNNIDIIHAHMMHSMMTAVIVKIFNPKIRVVFTSHSISFGSRFRKVVIFLLKFFRNKDILFSQEQSSMIYKKDVTFIPNGIDTNAYQKEISKFDKFTFLAVGRLEHVKNHIRLLQCAVELKKKNYNFQILIAGEGDQRKRFEKYICDNSLEENVTLLGVRSDIADLMAKSHVFVMPSLWEGLPISMLEAGASKLPVVTTPVGTITSLIDDNNGYLSTEDKFCQTMEEIMLNYEEATEKAIQLQNKIINRYSIDSIVNKHESLYKALIRDE